MQALVPAMYYSLSCRWCGTCGRAILSPTNDCCVVLLHPIQKMALADGFLPGEGGGTSIAGDVQQRNSQIGPPTPPMATVQRSHIIKYIYMSLHAKSHTCVCKVHGS